MRFLVTLLAVASSTLAALVARQSLPSCAVPCMTNADTGSCSSVDDSCLCTNQQFVNSTATCIASACTGTDLQNADAYAQQLCLAVGVTLSLSSVTSTSTSTASTASSTASSTSGAPMTSGINALAGAAAVLAIAVVL